jgi:hypothetical protein
VRDYYQPVAHSSSAYKHGQCLLLTAVGLASVTQHAEVHLQVADHT